MQMEMHADDNFSQCFDYASGATARRFQNPLWRVTELFTGRRFSRSIAVVKDFGRGIVASAVQDRNQQAKQHNSPDGDSKLDQISGSLIQSLLDALGNEQLTADAALTYLSAGRDTTAQALTWTFYLLAQHPEAVTKIRHEVDALLSQSQSPSLTASSTLLTPTALPYTTAVFHESLRLYPPIPFEIRQTQHPTTLPDGTHLPQNSVLVWCLWAMQRSRLTWGDDAARFRPERFLDAEGRFVARGAAEFPVFYGGARACLGRRMAEAIGVQVVAGVVVGLEVEGAWEEGAGRRSGASLTLPMEGGLPVRVGVRVREGEGGGDRG
jgi:cytochrome P450